MSSKIIHPEVMPIFERLKGELNLKNDAALARFMEIPARKLSVWKLRNFVPYELLTSLCSRHDLNLDWVMNGIGSPKRTLAAYSVAESSSPSYGLDDTTSKILQMLRDMDPDGRCDVLKYVEKEKLLAELKRERKKEAG